MLAEARKDWEAMRTISIDTIISCDRKKESKRKASLKDEKYAPFREYFKKLQKEKHRKCVVRFRCFFVVIQNIIPRVYIFLLNCI